MLVLSSHGVPPPPGDQTGHIRVWDLTANACSCELVPEVGTAGKWVGLLHVLHLLTRCSLSFRALPAAALPKSLCFLRLSKAALFGISCGTSLRDLLT